MKCWNELYFVQNLYQLITIKIMDIFFKDIVSGNLYFRSTGFSSVGISITFYRSNIGSVLKQSY